MSVKHFIDVGELLHERDEKRVLFRQHVLDRDEAEKLLGEAMNHHAKAGVALDACRNKFHLARTNLNRSQQEFAAANDAIKMYLEGI